MPVPWAPQRVRIADVENRAMTIQQLRDLLVFVKRLCKTRLLRDASGVPLSIYDVNMYHLADLVLRPAIRWVEEQRGTREEYSWVEFVARREEQAPDIMFSHSWAGRFIDFMSVVNQLAANRQLPGRVAIWICTFANNQFGENFGPSLLSCPFYKAVAATKSVVLVVDRDANSLQRIWCGFELHTTLLCDKPLDLYTAAGHVGVTVTSGPLVEAIEVWDVTRMEASQDSDRRQILNFFCGGEESERAGLKTDAAGELELVNGWQKQLHDVETNPEAPRRQDGREEYAHEASLLSKHSGTFDALNQAVRQKVLIAAQAPAKRAEDQAGSAVPRMEERGITLGELRILVKNMKAKALSEGLDWKSFTCGDVAEKMLPRMEKSQVHRVSWSRCADYFIDEVWGANFADSMAVVEWFASAQHLTDSTMFFNTMFCIQPSEIGSITLDWDASVTEVIKNCNGYLTLLPKGADMIVRSNRMFQLHICFENNIPVFLGCSTGVLSCTTAFPDGSQEFGVFDHEIAAIIHKADWRLAQSANKEAEQRYRDFVERGRRGFPGFQARLARTVVGPLLRRFVLQDSSEDALIAMQEICDGPSFNINSPCLLSAQGETALHIAAAANNISAMTLLLKMAADPNAEDVVLETPLHYAAMAGATGAVWILLQAGGMAFAESGFAETPLDVAQESPAAFLGKDTSKVQTLLQAWELGQREAQVPPKPDRHGVRANELN